MIPFEGLLPYAIIFTFFSIAGGGVAGLRAYRYDGKRSRYALDQWDNQLIERDFRLTGVYRAQSDKAIAPEYFKLNNFVKLEKESMWK